MEFQKELTIRVCKAEDLSALREICEETSTIPCKTDAQRQFLRLVYCDPYVLTQTCHCFVAVNEADVPLGYILCAPETRAFLRVFRRSFVPQIDRLGLHFGIQARASQTIHALFGRKYSAHLHIDLSEKARHLGTGTALMNALKAHLSAIGIHSLFLSCDKRNENALRFYARNGFESVVTLFGQKVLVCHF